MDKHILSCISNSECFNISIHYRQIQMACRLCGSPLRWVAFFLIILWSYFCSQDFWVFALFSISCVFIRTFFYRRWVTATRFFFLQLLYMLYFIYFPTHIFYSRSISIDRYLHNVFSWVFIYRILYRFYCVSL